MASVRDHEPLSSQQGFQQRLNDLGIRDPDTCCGSARCGEVLSGGDLSGSSLNSRIKILRSFQSVVIVCFVLDESMFELS